MSTAIEAMAKVTLNSAFQTLRGTIEGLVVRQTPHGAVLSRRPDTSKVKWSPAQRAHRRRMQEAARHYRKTMQDPHQAARLKTLAARAGIPVSSYVMGEFLRAPADSRR